MTFICGRAGVCALGAVIARHSGDERLLDYYQRHLVLFILYPCDNSNLHIKSSCLTAFHICAFA